MIRKSKKKGFTIVELVIVIAVIGVLAAVLIPTFISLNKKAEKAADSSLVQNLNTALRIEEASEGKNKTIHDAILDVDEYGYKIASLVSKSGEKLLWDQDKDEFFIDSGDEQYNNLQYWEIRSDMPGAGNKRSIYAGNGWTVTNVGGEDGINYGFDVGFNSNVESIYYKHSGTAQTVTIRTNSSATELTVEAPSDKIYHYGVAGVTDLTSVAPTSYFEKGVVSLAKLKNGRLVVTPESEIAGVHVVATNGNYDGIKIAVVGNAQLPSFTRDDVILEAEQSKLVVEVQTLAQESTAPSQDNTQYVWITGSTGDEVTASVSSSSTSATAPVASESAVATAVKTEARESTSAEELEQLEEAAARYAGGLGSEAKPYLLKTVEHFNSLNDDVNNNVTTGVYYKLTSDLTFEDYGMIGSVLYTSHGEQSGEVNSISAFKGHLDGDGHSVSYSITKSSTIASNVSSSGGAGLFASIESATIANLTINANINWTQAGYVGGVAGVMENCQISNVTVNGTIKGYKVVGGFAGLGYTLNNENPSSFTNCTNNALIISSRDVNDSSYQYVVAGGFIGEGSVYNYDGSWGGNLENRLTFTNCRNNGSFRYLGTGAKSIACFSNFIGFSSDTYFGSFYFNNCSFADNISYEGSLATQRTVSTKTILTGYSVANAALAPTIKYIGITSNVWGGNAAKNAIYVDDVLVEGSTSDHILVNA